LQEVGLYVSSVVGSKPFLWPKHFLMAAVQKLFEQRFSCPVCWCPKLRMVSGLCQHRVCEDCLYQDGVFLSSGFQRCPSCQQEKVFPAIKPVIPEDNIEIQKNLAIMACENEGCGQEFWAWEYSEHKKNCKRTTANTSKPLKRKREESTGSPVTSSPDERRLTRASKQEMNVRRSLRSTAGRRRQRMQFSGWMNYSLQAVSKRGTLR